MTDPEKRLWWHLRARIPMTGTHFRRQKALGPYVVDFVCLSHRLVIEVDGDQHGTNDALLAAPTPTPYPSPQGGGDSGHAV